MDNSGPVDELREPDAGSGTVDRMISSTPAVPGYATHTLLGFGSHGEVWLGEDLVSGERVALKIGRPPGAGPPGDAAEALAHEVALLSRLADEHVVRLHRVVETADGGHALVLEYAAGGNLGTLVVARGPLDPGEVSTLVVPLAQTLERLHARGLVHGDLSPGNVLLAADGRPLLSDLGVSRVLGTRTGAEHGTPGFTDPALGRGVDPRAGGKERTEAPVTRDPVGRTAREGVG